MVALLEKVHNILKNNILAFVMLPMIVGIHITWSNLQENPDLVKPHEKKELPIVRVSGPKNSLF
jgi:hypothetical protein